MVVEEERLNDSGAPELDMPRMIDLYCVRAVDKISKLHPCWLQLQQFRRLHQCCKPIFTDSLSSLGQWILLLPLKGNGLLNAYPKELTQSLWAWRVTGRNERTDGARKNWDLWCVVSDRASGWCVWCLWAGLNLAGQTVKLRAHTWNTVK